MVYEKSIFPPYFKNEGLPFSKIMWEDPVENFWACLVRDRAIEFMHSTSFLRSLRQKHDDAKRLQKRFGHVWQEYDTDIYKLIAEGCGENWDLEKKDTAVNQENKGDDNLVAARETGTRERLDELQGIVEESECVLEEEEGQVSKGKRQEEIKSSKRGRRSADFYRRAGCT